MTASGEFAYVYELALNSNGTFAIIGTSTNGEVAPIEQNVQVSATSPQVADNGYFTANVAGPQEFQYLGAAYDASFGEGYIAEFSPGGVGQGLYYFFTNQQYTGPGGLDSTDAGKLGSTNTGTDLTVCFMPGTRIQIPGGERPVEELKVGDLVVTSDRRLIPVRWIGRQSISRAFLDEQRLPIRIKAGALADNVPCRDLLVSPDHALFVDGILIHAGALVNGTSITRESKVPMSFAYYHVETDDHSLIMAENVPAETFVDNVDRAHFDNWDEYQALYPEGKAIIEMLYPRAKAYRQVPRSIRERLAERGLELFGAKLPSVA
jgi:Hint domain